MWAFGSRSENTAGFAGSGSGVQVISQSVVGPYDTVTLQSTDPNALDTWLNANGFVLPDKFRPTVAAYVAGGFDFIALKLRPDQGVDAMQPVRIVTPGADATLPLRMVAAGVGAQVGITLYVISEGRYEANSPFSMPSSTTRSSCGFNRRVARTIRSCPKRPCKITTATRGSPSIRSARR